jgi:hypothetical protein
MGKCNKYCGVTAIRRCQNAIILLSRRFWRGMPGGPDRNRRGLARKRWAKDKAAPKGGPVPGGISFVAP